MFIGSLSSGENGNNHDFIKRLNGDAHSRKSSDCKMNTQQALLDLTMIFGIIFFPSQCFIILFIFL